MDRRVIPEPYPFLNIDFFHLAAKRPMPICAGMSCLTSKHLPLAPKAHAPIPQKEGYGKADCQSGLSRVADPFHQPLDVQAVDGRLAVPVALEVDALRVRRKHGRYLVRAAGAVLAQRQFAAHGAQHDEDCG